MSTKVHFLHLILISSLSNLSGVNEEQEERFYKDLKIMETRYRDDGTGQ